MERPLGAASSGLLAEEGRQEKREKPKEYRGTWMPELGRYKRTAQMAKLLMTSQGV
jgi:hypothetical protein